MKLKIVRFIAIAIVVIAINIIIHNVTGKLITEHFENPSIILNNKNYDSIFDVLNISSIGRLLIAYTITDVCYLVNSLIFIIFLNYFLINKHKDYEQKDKKKQIIENRGILSRIKIFLTFLKWVFTSLFVIDILIVVIKSVAIAIIYFTENMYEIGKIYSLSIDLQLIRVLFLLILLVIIPMKMHLHMKSKAIKRWTKKHS